MIPDAPYPDLPIFSSTRQQIPVWMKSHSKDSIAMPMQDTQTPATTNIPVRTVSSSPPVARSVPFGLKATVLTHFS